MDNLSSKEKILIGVVLFIAIICAYYFLALKPIYNKIDAENQTIISYNSKIVTLGTLARKNKKDQIDLDALKVKALVMTSKLPKVEKNPQIAFDIKSSADNYTLSIKDINFTTPTQYILDSATTTTAATTKANQVLFSKLQVVPVKVTILGSYNNIKNFIQEIETQSRIAIIKSADLTPSLVSSTAATTTTKTSMVSPLKSITISQVSSKQSNIKNIILLNDLQSSTPSTKTKATSTSTATGATGAAASTNSAVAALNGVQAVIEINYYYVLSETNIGEYNFNTGTYGKTDVFK